MDNREQNVRIKRQRMSRQQRAKQFAPFAAVTGLNEALRRKEEEHLEKLRAQVVGVKIEE